MCWCRVLCACLVWVYPEPTCGFIRLCLAPPARTHARRPPALCVRTCVRAEPKGPAQPDPAHRLSPNCACATRHPRARPSPCLIPSPSRTVHMHPVCAADCEIHPSGPTSLRRCCPAHVPHRLSPTCARALCNTQGPGPIPLRRCCPARTRALTPGSTARSCWWTPRTSTTPRRVLQGPGLLDPESQNLSQLIKI